MNNGLRKEQPLAAFDAAPALATTLGSAKPAGGATPGVFQYKGYFASALTNLTTEQYAHLQKIRKVADDVCRAEHIALYVPMDHTDPKVHVDIPATEVYTKDRRSVSEADLLILVATAPSFGAGQELEIARAALIPIIALVPTGTKLSRMVHGSPTFKVVIEFNDMDDLGRKLAREIKRIYPWFDEARKARALLDRESFGPRVRDQRQRLRLTQQQLADRTGVTLEEIQVLEEERMQFSNPSAIFLAKLARSLELPIGHLLNPEPATPYILHAIKSLGPVEKYVAGARNRRNLSDKDRKLIEQRLVEDIRRSHGGTT